MSKRNHIVERASDVNGGQYIQTNPSYNSGYEDGKKAGKEYCASEITTLREQVEKLAKELDNVKQVEFPRRVQKVTDALKRKHEKELAALAEQNEKMRAFVTKISEQTPEKPDYWSSCGQCEHNSSNAEDLLELPNLASPVLNRIRAEGIMMAVQFCIDNPLSDAHCLAEMLRARADELRKTNA